MNNVRQVVRGALWMLIGLAGWASAATAQTPEEQKAFDRLIRMKKYISEVMNDGMAPGERTTVFTVLLPGIGIHEKRDGSDADASAAMPAWVLNTLPSTDLTGNTSTANITEWYRKALFASEPKDANALAKAEEDSKKVEDIDLELGKWVEPYVARRLDYINAHAEYREARIKFGDSATATFKADGLRKNSMELWKTQGFKVKYENKSLERNRLLLGGIEPWLLWQKRFVTGVGDIDAPDIDADFAVKVYPEYKNWTQGPGWMEMSFGAGRLKTYAVNRTTSGAASGEFSILGIGGGGAGNYNRTSAVSQDASESMSLTMKVKRVLIARAWGDPEVFRSPNWRWKDPMARGVAQNMISEGRFDKTKGSFIGRKPLYPTSLLLAKDIEITAKFSKEDKENINTSLSANTKGGFLFFRTRASASSNVTTALVEKADGHATLKIPDAQIIGYFCEILPVCPAPDPKVKEANLDNLKPDDL
jgi:hypothetical protein